MSGTLLGKDEHGNNVEISITNRLPGFYCIGSNGTGKSTLLNQMIVQDIKAGMGAALLDPHGDLCDYVLSAIPDERIDDVILLDPIELARQGYYFGLNLFHCKDADDPVSVEDAVERIIHVYEKIFGMTVAETPLLSQFVRHVARTFVGTQYTMIEIPLLLLDKAFRDRVVPQTGGTGLFWNSYDSLSHTEQLKESRSTYDRIDSLVSNSIIYSTVGQSQSTLHFREILDTGKILLCKLPGRMESFSSLLGAILIGQLLEAALSRENIPEKQRRQFNLYVDEFQNFATSDMARLLSEARKYKIASHLFHQFLGQLDEKNKGAAMQAGSLVVFRVNAEDAKFLAPAFSLTPKPGDPIERPVRTYKQEIISHLLEKGHTSKEANDYVNELLRPMQETLEQLKDKVARTAMSGRLTKTSGLFVDQQTYYTFASHLRDGMAKVNHILVKAMEGRLSVKSPQFQSLVCDAIITLRGYLEVQGGVEEVDEEKIPLPPELYTFVEDTVRLECGANYDDPSQEEQDQYKRTVREIKATHMKHLREGLNYWLIQREQYSDKFVDEGVKWRASTELGSITGFVTWMELLCNELAKEPIMVDSGKYEQVEGPKMTYADMANMVANEITQYPVGRARAKLTVTKDGKPVIIEHMLTTIPPQAGLKDLASKKQRIIDNTRQNYCRPRSDIEEEIRRRQEPPPPPTRKHEL
jgi:hypothetical protein